MTRKKILILVAVLAVVAAGAAGAFLLWPKPVIDERVEDPEKYISLALQNTYELINIPRYDSEWLFDILGGRQQLEVGLSFKDIDIADVPIDRQFLSYAQLMRLETQVLRDPQEKKLLTDLSIAGGGAAMLNAELYLSEDELAVKLPQGFDYFITLDPRKAVSDWNTSPLAGLGRAPEGLTDTAIYEQYKKLFQAIPKPAKLQLVNDTLTLYRNATYEFSAVEEGLYSYTLTLKCDDFNEWFRSLVKSLEDYEPLRFADVSQFYNFSVTDDVTIGLSVRDDKVVAASVLTRLQEGVIMMGKLQLNGEANPFDDVSVKIDMQHPASAVVPGQREHFDIAGAVNPYLMIDQMPKAVSITITHRGDSQTPDLFFSDGTITMSGVNSTKLAWVYQWDTSGDTLDNFKLKASLTENAGDKTAGLQFNMEGSIVEDREKAEFLSNFSDISCTMTDFNEDEQGLALTLKLNLKAAPDTTADYDRITAVRITELSPMQLLKMYGGFKADPVIGGFLQ